MSKSIFDSVLLGIRQIQGFFRLKPRLTVALCVLAMCGDLVAAYGLPWLLLLPLCALVPFISDIRKSPAAFFLLLFCPIVGAVNFTWRDPTNRNSHFCDHYSEKTIVVKAVVVDTLPAGRGQCRTILDCEKVLGVEGEGAAQANVLPPAKLRLLFCSHSSAVFQPLDEIEASGRLRMPRGAIVPWDFDERNYLFKYGVDLILTDAGGRAARTVGRRTPGVFDVWQSQMQKTRLAIKAAHCGALGQEKGELLSSMVIGDAAVRVSPTLNAEFQTLSLTHIIAASGFNLTVVTAVTWWLVSLFTRSRFIMSLVALASVLAFVGVAGASASVERAAIMCVIVLAASCFWRKCYLPATLGFAGLLSILWQPSVVRDVGFQLSYIATVGIVCGAQSTSERFRAACPRVSVFIIELIAVGFVAQASVLPLQLIYFWKVGMLSLPANLLIAPLVPAITIIGFASSGLAVCNFSPMSGLVLALDQVAGLPLQLMLAVVETLARLKWIWCTGPPSAVVVAVYYTSGAVLLTLLKHGGGRFAGCAALVVFLCAMGLMLQPIRLPENLVVAERCSVLIIVHRQATLLSSRATQNTESERKHLERMMAYFAITKLQAAKSSPLKLPVRGPVKHPRIYMRRDEQDDWRRVDSAALPSFEELTDF